MSIEPYRYANGEVHGATETPSPGAESSPRRGRATSALALRVRRRKTDPLWAERSEESRRRLLALDAAEERGRR